MVDTKVCSKCKEEKHLDDFYKTKAIKSGFVSACKKCNSLKGKKYHKNNKEKINKCKKNYYANNKNITLGRQKIYYENNKEAIKVRHKKYNRDNIEALKEYGKIYRINNKEKEKGRSREYYKNNKGQVKVRTNKYKEDNKEAIKESSKRYRENNKEAIKESGMRYYQDNKETIKERCAEYYKDNKNKAKERKRKRRARKIAVNENYTKMDERVTYSVFNYECFNCKSTYNLALDHHYCLNDGNPLTIDNAVILCRSCNSSKGTKKPEEFYNKLQLKNLNKLFKKAKQTRECKNETI